MHQAILSRAGKNADVISRHPLRFLRSSSSSMPPQVIRELEEVFQAPLIEAYGMTEATHQMASNPLPPEAAQARRGRPRRPARGGHHGEDGKPARAGGIGEIVIRGANVHAATRTTRRPMPRASRTAGSAPATRARSTPTAT
jgi:acyl-coenzyme A synthetase/AMP-(fatty) acid ligase